MHGVGGTEPNLLGLAHALDLRFAAGSTRGSLQMKLDGFAVFQRYEDEQPLSRHSREPCEIRAV